MKELDKHETQAVSGGEFISSWDMPVTIMGAIVGAVTTFGTGSDLLSSVP